MGSHDEPNLEGLSLLDDGDEGFCFDIGDDDGSTGDLQFCLVGRFLSDRPIHVKSMKARMADIWRPVKKVMIKEAMDDRILFQFSHQLDMEAALKGGPWSYDNHLLVIEKVQVGVQIENIPLFHVEFWVQVHNLPAGLMLEKVGRTMANFIGSFVEYDKNNNSSFWRQYMRLRVKIDVRLPLKTHTRVKNKGGEWCTVKFKFEKLSIFCFVSGILGHTEQRCAVRFAMEEDPGVRGWSAELRPENRKFVGGTSRWLQEEEGGKKFDSPARMNQSPVVGSGGEEVPVEVPHGEHVGDISGT
ncbi:uncharacterized protein At4g02000-like [Vicia villosa]|uniref:uncharacterized protein At4g02000-like n=1 Tax=Vicia villosa TaxID=3911 RepID=UPI00273B3873|nr:uncharacterized protein At4g02000-like [Vicia villosa]